jgi:hypothetical protein
MTCGEFEQGWNDLLDAHEAEATLERRCAKSTAVAQLESALREHESGCAACREVAARYRLLLRAIRAWSVPQVAPGQLADRILAASRFPPLPRGARVVGASTASLFRRNSVSIAAAAAAAIAFALIRPANQPRPAGAPSPKRPSPPTAGTGSRPSTLVDTRSLNAAVAEAAEATLDLARSASEPAARISRQVLNAATMTQVEPGPTVLARGAGSEPATLAVPILGSLAPDSKAASAMLQALGDRFASGVRPFSTTARNAFGFLLGPSPSRPDVRESPQSTKGT